MSELRYRVKTSDGLSEPWSLPTVEAHVASGRLSLEDQCTTDEGTSWQSVGELSAFHESSAQAATEETGVGLTSVRDSNETLPASGGRKLKRLPVPAGKSRYARLTDSHREERKASHAKLSALVGRELSNGRYQVLSQFGSGSMAYVFRASDNRLETDVIIKVPKPEKITSDDFRERFRRESQLLVRLSHPHVVKVLDVGEVDDLPYVVMQLLSGGTLLDRLRDDCNEVNQMSPQSLQTWLREVARALDFCYRKGMVHRDVKPANILFDDDGNPYVSDFGLTKIMHGEHTELCSNGTANGVVLGTPNYLPPEIILGAPYDGRADQYSLALTVYHVLCGRPPMQGRSATATMINQTQKTLELLSSFRTDVPRELALAVQKGIEKQPADRFDSCEAFADAVLECLRTDSSSEILLGGLNSAFAREAAEAEDAGPSAGRSGLASSPQPSISSSSSWSSGSARRSGSSASSRRTRRTAKSKSGSRDTALPAAASGSGRRRPGRVSRGAQAPTNSAANTTSESSENVFDENAWRQPDTQQLPPRRRQRPKSKPKASNRGGREVVVFGMAMHPAALVLAAAMVLLPSTIFIGLWMASSSASREQADYFVLPDDSQSSAGSTTGPANADQDEREFRQQRQNKTQFAQRSFEDSGESRPSAADSSRLQQPDVATNDPRADNPSTDAPPANQPRTARAPSVPVIALRAGDAVTRGAVTSPRAVIGVDVWDLLRHEKVATLDGDYPQTALTALSADGHWFAAVSQPPGVQGSQVTVWNTSSGQKAFRTDAISERFVDALLLSPDRLLLGDRWSDELLVWDLASGRPRRSVHLPHARFKQDNTTVSADGQFLAAVINDDIRVFRANDGTGVVALQHSGSGGRRSDAAGRSAGLQALAFSPSGEELAAIMTNGPPRFVCWNGRGEVVLESRSISRPRPHETISWFQGRRAWLLGDEVLDGNTGRIVARVPQTSVRQLAAQLLDDSHLLVADTMPDRLTRVPIPWNDIQRATNHSRIDSVAALRPDGRVAVDLRLPGDDEELKSELRRTLKKHAASLGLNVVESADVVLTLRLASAEEQFVENRSLQRPVEQRFGSPGERLQAAAVVLEVSDRSQAAVWSAIVNRDLRALQRGEDEQSSDVTARLGQMLQDVAIPHYLPTDPQFLALPVLLEPASAPSHQRLATGQTPVRQ